MKTETKYRKGARVKSLRMFVTHYEAGDEFWLNDGLSSSGGFKLGNVLVENFNDIIDWIDDGFLFLAVPYEAKSATPDAVVEEKGDGAVPKSVTPATTFKPVTMTAPPPCSHPCPKCGETDICRELIEKGRKAYPPMTPSEFPYKFMDKQAYDHEAIRNHCRCCQYEWDSLPLDAAEPKP